MIRYATRTIVSALAFILIIGGSGTAQAEVSVDLVTNGRPQTLMMRDDITDGIDPIPQLWQAYRSVSNQRILNPSGTIRPDDEPDVAYHPTTGNPIVAWAYNNGTERDIALAYWTGTSWSAVEFLTASAEDEVDPKVFVERNGTIHVVWWVDSNDPQVRLMTRHHDADFWEAPIQVSPVGQAGRHPSVAVFQDVLWILLERDLSVGETAPQPELALFRRDATATEFVEHDSYSPLVDQPSPRLEVLNGHLWASWRQSATDFAYASFSDPGWSAVELLGWTDDSWLGWENARKAIARLVIVPSVAVDPGLNDN